VTEGGAEPAWSFDLYQGFGFGIRRHCGDRRSSVLAASTLVELGNVVVNSPIAIDRLVNGLSSETTVGVALTPTSTAPTAGLNK
jgi:hypothetical protein